MPARHLPARPDVSQLKRQAAELLRAHRDRRASAGARVAAHHPRWSGRSVEDVLDGTLKLADAQLVVAREYGFDSWPALRNRIEMVGRLKAFELHPAFGDALDALDAGDIGRLRSLLASEPSLVHARANLEPEHGYFAGATLLHHIAGNPRRGAALPPNIVEIARVLLDAGADVNAATLGPNGGTTMGLLVTSAQASELGVSGPLMDVLLQHGATLRLDGEGVLDPSLANHAPRAAEKLIALGVRPDVLAAAALGRKDLLKGFFGHDGRLRSSPQRNGKVLDAREAAGLALLYAYVRNQAEAVDFLLDMDVDLNVTGVNNGAILHRAAYAGDLETVKRVVARGADMSNRANPFNSTPLSWAAHGRQTHVFEWMRRNCTIDLHEAVCHDLPEHVAARLHEDPGAVNRSIDHWDLPRCTPLHWAVCPYYEDDGGTHEHDPARRLQLVHELLESGADPNIVAGDGRTPLDIALRWRASDIATLIESFGGKRAEEL